MDCPNLSECGFIECCNQKGKSAAVNGFINTYCKGEKMGACVRKKLALKFGKQVVPKNMMPNGFPMPETDKHEWSEQALYYQKYI